MLPDDSLVPGLMTLHRPSVTGKPSANGGKPRKRGNPFGGSDLASSTPGPLRQSVTDTASFPTATVPRIVIIARLLRIVRHFVTPYLVRHSEKTNESIPGSQNDSLEQSPPAESENSFKPWRSSEGDHFHRNSDSATKHGQSSSRIRGRRIRCVSLRTLSTSRRETCDATH